MFVPILMLHRVADSDVAMRLANDTDLGLTAGFYGAVDEVPWFHDHIEAGVTYANRRQGATTGAWPGYQPFAGWKGSSSTGKAIASYYYLAQYLREQSRTVVDPTPVKLKTLQEAIALHVADGACIALEGFTHLIPFAAGHEIIRQGRRDLHLVRMTPDLIYDQMIGMGCAGKLTFSWGGNPGVGSLHRLRDAVEHRWPRAARDRRAYPRRHGGGLLRWRSPPAIRGAARLPRHRLAGGATRASAASNARSRANDWPPCPRSIPTSRSCTRSVPTAAATSRSTASSERNARRRSPPAC